MHGDDSGGKLSKGDASILRFLAAAEIIESDFWEQYWELGGAQPTGTIGVPENDFAATNPSDGKKPKVTGGNAAYTKALQILDMATERRNTSPQTKTTRFEIYSRNASSAKTVAGHKQSAFK